MPVGAEATAETAEGETKAETDGDKKEGVKDDKKEDVTKKTPTEKK